jgi:hypothetical protein
MKLPEPPPQSPKHWNPFEPVIETARSWVPPRCRFQNLSEIRIVTNRHGTGYWHPPQGDNQPLAYISIGWKEGVPLVWHEAFHSVFDGSIMRLYDPDWMEGWCNAFAEVHHRYFHAPDPKRLKPGTHGKCEYTTPAYLLCKKAKFDAARLKKLWLEWNRTDPVPRPKSFTRFMRYEPKTGKIW